MEKSPRKGGVLNPNHLLEYTPDVRNLKILNDLQEFYKIDWINLLKTRFYFFGFPKFNIFKHSVNPLQT